MALTQKQLSALRAEYLHKREQLLIKKVDRIAIILFEKVFDNYLVKLEMEDGKLLASDKNFNIVKGLDEIYNSFVRSDNIPVIKSFIQDLQGINPINERYFSNIRRDGIKATSERVAKIVDKSLGINGEGGIIKDGYADKFIRDKMVLKAIKKETNQALTNKTGFQEFRQNMQTLIQGSPKNELSGKLQQYYRNNAYDTYTKVDRLNQDLYAADLGLRYFVWSGGIILTTRPICRVCDSKIVDSKVWDELTFEDIKVEYQEGMDENSILKDDLGGYGCRHQKDYILDSVAKRREDKMLDFSIIVK